MASQGCQDLERGTAPASTGHQQRHTYPPRKQRPPKERLIAKIHLDYDNAPNFFSDKLPPELHGKVVHRILFTIPHAHDLPFNVNGIPQISPEEFNRRITILNEELGKQRSLHDMKMVMRFYMWWLSGFFCVVTIISFVVYTLFANSDHADLAKKTTIGVVAVCFLGLMVSTSPAYIYMNPSPVFPADPVVENILKGWSDLDAECGLRWVSKRNTYMHYRRTLAPWTIEAFEFEVDRELPPSFEVAAEVPPSYTPKAKPGTASQPNA
ncbi:hypothetical protein HDU96_005596 [Phlyctochytrium bullatum]|nr:hypothetical protein HDU96_005596 [Phlyctochytrium bullatum]